MQPPIITLTTSRDPQPRGLFVTGTDTGVGKTYVTTLIARELLAAGLQVGVYKPVCTGSVAGADGKPVWSDVEQLSSVVAGRFEQDRVCPQRFHAALAPPVAARLEGKSVDAGLLRAGARWWQQRVELLLVEGIGGLLCPLTEDETVADLARDLNYPLIVVARLGLGTINHTLLTVEAARNRGLTVAGVVLNQADPAETGAASATNPAELAARSPVPVLGVVGYNQPDGLLRDGRRIRIDWAALALSTVHLQDSGVIDGH